MLHPCAGREPSGSAAYTAVSSLVSDLRRGQNHDNGHRPPERFCSCIVNDITPEPLQILKKWDTDGHRRIALAFSK